ncbi:MAG TPA: hypothetical protein VFJ06_05175 [Halococcus sp.]|nr:hypothetical protein [Halococcus sp.]
MPHASPADSLTSFAHPLSELRSDKPALAALAQTPRESRFALPRATASKNG